MLPQKPELEQQLPKEEPRQVTPLPQAPSVLMTWVGVGEGWDEVVEVVKEEEVGSGVTAGGGLAVPPATQ